MDKELYYKAKKCTTVDELIALSNETDEPLNKEDAIRVFHGLKTIGEVNDEQLDNVNGGLKFPWESDDNPPDPLYKVGDRVRIGDRGIAVIVEVSTERKSFWEIDPEWKYYVQYEERDFGLWKWESDITEKVN